MFSYRDNEEGKAGTGELPAHLVRICARIHAKWAASVPDLDALTYHTWYSDMPENVKKDVDELRSDPFFYALCDPAAAHERRDEKHKCRIFPIDDMNELYYSNVSQEDMDGDMFGATSNFLPHKDMYFTIQPGIRVYRVLIGISESNETVSTVFDAFNAKKKLNRGDFIAFDFSKTTHHVEVESLPNLREKADTALRSESSPQKQNGRIMLKLHYVVSEPGQTFSDEYIHLIKWLHVQYEYVTRYIMKTGTNPKTYYQFFIGLLSQSFMNPIAKYVALALFVSFAALIVATMGVKWTRKRPFLVAFTATAGLFVTYLLYVLWYFAKHVVFTWSTRD